MYLDEFGHIGPYLSPSHAKHNTHPVFGLAGVALPARSIREFSTFFFKLKNNLLKFEIDKSGIHPAKWEKKGSALYTTINVTKYRELRAATNRLLNKIKELNGFVFYVGIEKELDEEKHNSKNLYHAVMKEAIKRIDQELEYRSKKGLIIIDQTEKNVMRAEIVEKTSIAIYSSHDPRKSIVEPPIEAESHLYQGLQCADWLCGLVGRLSRYQIESTLGYEIFEKYFDRRVKEVVTRSSIRRIK